MASSFKAVLVGVCCGALVSAAAAMPFPYPAPQPHPHPMPMGAYDPYDPYCPYPQQQDGQYDYGQEFNGLYGSGDSGYAQGYDAFSSYSGYGAGSQGGYGGGYADPSGRSASAFGVGFGRR